MVLCCGGRGGGESEARNARIPTTRARRDNTRAAAAAAAAIRFFSYRFGDRVAHLVRLVRSVQSYSTTAAPTSYIVLGSF